jgi:hypothetical protein
MNDNDSTLPGGWRPAFLAALAETGNIRGSARKACIAQTTAYDARGRHPDFAAAWDEAIAGKEYRRRGAPVTVPVPAPVAAPPEGPVSTARSAHWRNHFFEALAETSSVSAAAARARVPLKTVYRLKREDGEFGARWLAALHEGYDHLEMELLGYLRDPAPARKMDVAGALRLLAAHRETVERRRALDEEDDEQAVLESIDRFIDEMQVRRAANNAILIETGGDDGAE